MRIDSPEGEKLLKPDAVVLALGGGSWARLGSDGAWMPLLAERGVEQERFVKKAEMFQQLKQRRALPFSDADSYRVLKVATEAFVMVNCGV